MPDQYEVEGEIHTSDFYTIQTQTGWGRTLSHFADWCAPQHGWQILDVGCGPGFLPHLFTQRGCFAVGIDLDQAAYQPTPLHPNVLVGDGNRLPFPPETYHLITASNVLFLTKDPVALLIEITRVLAPQGQAAFLNPSEHMSRYTAKLYAEERQLAGEARRSFLNWAERAETHHRWSAEDLENLLASTGMKLIETELKIGLGLARFARAIKI